MVLKYALHLQRKSKQAASMKLFKLEVIKLL